MKRITASQYQTSERYYKLPKLLFESERYKNMKLEVKVAYSILKDRLAPIIHPKSKNHPESLP
ncbi:replication initiator protein [Streptococcus pneumoniae]|nr:replication initiator protein [Streptococcus pneumoniae]